ncbi:hypothetical protein BOTBODRAFT_53315 [Botryobasidium botryosum FD-172 SS1]|uniref:Uncharacterized protein n=1 Tax=Botryobasidium botryosum (strain FD-172 SS1) TaxID=930990 RepID=A0A067N206_BOTB1|nr:hypothetical protein BOTBODRAFT_53315 [Botryobasidium botryosum FD-172 SS1]
MEASTISQIVKISSALVVAEQAHANDGRTPAPNSPEQLDREIKHLAQVRDRIAKALKHTEERLSELRHRKNQHVPAYRLPHDAYFHLFKLMHYADFTGGVGWRVSHVSKMWREIALSTPQLWSTIDIINPEFIKACIARSGDMSLDVAFDAPLHRPVLSTHISSAQAEKAKLSVASLLPHAHRWGSLSLVRVDKELFSPLLSARAPRLEKLRLECFTASLPPDKEAFLENSPRLRYIRLGSSTLAALAYTTYTGLTELRLDSITSWIRHDQFFDLLRRSPLLEVLDLNEIQFAPSSVPAVFTPIRLPHLRHVEMTEMLTWGVQTILSAIRAPPTLTIKAVICFLGDEDLSSLLLPRDELEESLPSLLRIEKLAIGLKGIDGMPFIRGYAGSEALLDLTCDPCEVDGPGFRSAIFRSFGRTFSFPSVEKLRIRRFDNEMMEEDVFADVLGNLPSVVYLTIDRCGPACIRKLIVDSTNRLCPNLESLTIVGDDVDEDGLEDLVASRVGWGYEEGCRLLKLVLPREKAIHPRVASKLKIWVGRVVVGGEEVE